MRIIAAKDYAEMSRKGAAVVASTVVLNPKAVLGLATGSTPVGMYQQLVKWYNQGDLDFKSVQSVNLDEYVGLDGESDQSYRYFMNNNLFSHVNIDIKNTHVPNGRAADLEGECKKYDSLIEELGGVELQVLGIGNNGHIGFNEPADSFDKGTHLVDLKESTIQANARFFASIDDVPRQALTMGIQTIMRAKNILLLVSGSGKKDILFESICGPITPNVPASVLQLHPSCTVVADDEALEVVKSKGGFAL